MDIKTLMSEHNRYWYIIVTKRNKSGFVNDALAESWMVNVQQSGKSNTVIN